MRYPSLALEPHVTPDHSVASSFGRSPDSLLADVSHPTKLHKN